MGVWRILRWLAGLTGVVVGAALAVWLVLWVSLRSSSARVPDVRGMEPARAVATLQEAGLIGRMQDSVFSTTVLPGRVAEQRPSAGYQLKRGDTVLVYPSLGRAAAKVPDLTGLPESVAEADLDAASMSLGLHCEVEGQSDAVVVLAQSPEAGTLVAPGTSIAVLVNRTPAHRRYVMPDFVGMRVDDASRILRGLGFRLANVQAVRYPGVTPGTVLRQDPSAGGPVLSAAVVGLWVSQ